MATLVPLIIMAFWIGLYPAPFFKALDKPVNKLVRIVQPDFFQAAPDQNAEAAAENPAPAPVAGDTR
jgi:NADH-quinone oxidoreductase subunit M